MSIHGVVWTRRARAVVVAAVAAAVLGTGGAGALSGAATSPGAPAAQLPSSPVGGNAVAWGSKKWGDKEADAAAKEADGSRNGGRDPGSLFTVTTTIGARAVWGQKDASGRAITGQGVTVALLDSGVKPVPGLSGAGKLIHGPDLSLETNSPDLQGVDTYGHGTHLAGIIAGRDDVPTDPTTGQPKPASPQSELGVAPDARLLGLKVATTDGSTDVSQVIAALDWVVEHRNDNGMRVRVVNLAFGTTALQPYEIDPLAAAAENAWRKGLVVVVSGGNEGPTAGALTNPAIDPYVIAVGASDPNGTVGGWNTPTVASFSSRGTTSRYVDLVAPGRSIVSLRNPGSFVDTQYPEGLVDGDKTGRLFRGSGTSQAAAVVSGAAALLLQADPTLTPDRVKAILTATAKPIAGANKLDVGAGQLDVAAAYSVARAAKDSVTVPIPPQAFPVSTGSGSLDAARGATYLYDAETGEPLRGEVDVQSNRWDPAAWYAATTAETAWDGGLWLGARWSGDGWSGARWSSSAWTGARWSGARWSDASWDGARWSGARWSGARWSGARWSGARWSDSGWF